MEDDQQFCLRWNNHQNTIISNFDKLLENGTLVDCTLAAEGQFLKAHKVVLSACSPYFANLLKEQYDKHPIFILKDVKYQELRAMMDYMYRGEVNISQDQLAALLKAAESLQIKGLSDRPQRSADQHQNINVPGRMQHPHGGYTLEQAKRPRLGPVIDTSDMREGSSSPTSRKRKKLRRRSIENVIDNHEHSNSSAHSTQPINTSTPSITSGTAAIVATSQQQQQQSQQSLQQSSVTQQQQQGNIVGTKKTENVSNIKQTAGSSDDVILTDQDNQIEQDKQLKKDQMKQQRKSGHDKDELLIEPKNEYEEVNDPIEDLTEDPEELMDDEDLDNQPGPSHHGGEGSSQGFPQWPADRSQDEFIMTAQDQGQQRDPQAHNSDHEDNVDLKYKFYQSMDVSDYSNHIDGDSPKELINSANNKNNGSNSLNVNQQMNNMSVIMTQDGQRFPCGVCGKSYLRKRHLQRHMRDECIGIPPRFKCDLCPSRFRRKYHMVRHMNSKHGVPPPPTSSSNVNAGSNNTQQQQQKNSTYDDDVDELKPENLCIKKENYESDNGGSGISIKSNTLSNSMMSGGAAAAALAATAGGTNNNNINIIPAHMDRVVQASVLAAMNAAAVAVGVPNLSNSPHHRSGSATMSDQRIVSGGAVGGTDVANENQCNDENRITGNGTNNGGADASDGGVMSVAGMINSELNQQLFNQNYFDERDSKDNLRDIKAVINDDDWKMKLSLQLISNSLLKERLVNAMPFAYNNN